MACSRPDAAATPTPAQQAGVAPATPTALAAYPAADPASYPSAYPAPRPTIVTPTMQPSATPPPTPALPLEQALPAFPRRALLYAWQRKALMLGDPASGASLRVSEPFCPLARTQRIYAEWSADGQFIAMICQDDDYQGTLHILAMQTGTGRQVAAGSAVGFAWAPTGHQLLIAEQTATRRAVLQDAQTGAETALPVAPLWQQPLAFTGSVVGEIHIPSDWLTSDSSAAMAWSPDGASIAVITDQITLIDADAAHAHNGALAVRATLPVRSLQKPRWSHDGQFIYTKVSYRTPHNPSSSSNVIRTKWQRVEVSTGVVTDTLNYFQRWAPDGAHYLEWETDTYNWGLYRADGTAIDTIPDLRQGGPFWLPDSRRVLFLPSPGTAFVVLDLEGNRQIIRTPDGDLSASERYGSSIAPGGDLLATTRKDDHLHLVVYDLQGNLRATFMGGMLLGWRPEP